MLHRELLRWFDDAHAAKLPPEQRPADPGTRDCALCERAANMMLAVVHVLPATKRTRAAFVVPGVDNFAVKPGAIPICSRCAIGTAERLDEFGDDPNAWPNPDMVVAEASRALEAEGSPEARALMKQIVERSRKTAPRRPGTLTCDACKERRLCIGGPRARLCFDCVRGAQRRLIRLFETFSAAGRRR